MSEVNEVSELEKCVVKWSEVAAREWSEVSGVSATERCCSLQKLLNAGMIRWWSSNRGGREEGEGENHLSQKVSSHLWCKQLEISQPASQPLCAISPVRVPSYYNRFARSFFSPCFLFFLSFSHQLVAIVLAARLLIATSLFPFTISIFLRLSRHRFY